MSWIKYQSGKISEEDLRESRRQKLEADRLARAKQREASKRQIQEAALSKEAAEEACKDILSLDPDILVGEDVSVDDSEIEQLLDQSRQSEASEIMTDFDAENGVDGKNALGELKGVQCPFTKDDIEFWFGQLEGQLEVIEIKSQWLKRIAVQRFLPPEIQEEVKGLLSLGKTAAGDTIYLQIKTELIELFGRKPEDAYTRAKNRVLSGKPSQLGKALINDLCKNARKLDGCCCGDIIWGMFREKLPIVVRNHIAELSFNKDTYKAVLTKADQVWDSNKESEPLPRAVAAVTTSDTPQVAAVQKSPNFQGSQKNKNNKNSNQGQNKGQKNQNKGQNKQDSPPTPKVNEESLCRIHAKWKNDANFCAAPWACKMKNVYRAPQ